MAKTSVETYLSTLHKSKLVTKNQLGKMLDKIKKEVGNEPVTLQYVADACVKAGLVTSWQNEKLMKGRHQGFFLGNYKLLGHIAAGGMSNIYLAEHLQMQRQVAIKVLPPSLTENSSYLERFYVESRAIAALDHKNIVRAYDVARQDKYHYLVMEYVPGVDLRELVHKKGTLPYEVAAEYIRQAADGLSHAHERGLIHRDIKPANLLVDQEGVIKVLDMGLSRITQDTFSLTRAHNENVIGTVDYLAPEQAVDSHSVDVRADLYSLGCTLYFLLTGHPPFPTGSHTQRLMKHQTENPSPIEDERPDAPPELLAICRKMMAKRPEDRYQTATEIRDTLHRWLEACKARVKAKEQKEASEQLRYTAEISPARDMEAYEGDSPSIDIQLPSPEDSGTELNVNQQEVQVRLKELEGRQRELTDREEQLDEREQKLRARFAELKQREAALSERSESKSAAPPAKPADPRLAKLEGYLEQKAEELEQRAADMDRARNKLTQLEQFLEKKAADVERRQGEVETARAKLIELEQFIESKAMELEEKTEAAERWALENPGAAVSMEDSQQVSRGADIANREQQVAEREAACEKLKAELESQSNKLKEQQAQLEKLQAASKEQEKQLAQKSQEIQTKLEEANSLSKVFDAEQEKMVARQKSLDEETNQLKLREDLLQKSLQDLDKRWARLDRKEKELLAQRQVMEAAGQKVDNLLITPDIEGEVSDADLAGATIVHGRLAPTHQPGGVDVPVEEEPAAKPAPPAPPAPEVKQKPAAPAPSSQDPMLTDLLYSFNDLWDDDSEFVKVSPNDDPYRRTEDSQRVSQYAPPPVRPVPPARPVVAPPPAAAPAVANTPKVQDNKNPESDDLSRFDHEASEPEGASVLPFPPLKPLPPEPQEKWPFDESCEVKVLTTKAVVEEGFPILIARRGQHDFPWQFLDNALSADTEGIEVSLQELAGIDPTIYQLAKMPVGWQAWRASARDPWHKAPASTKN